MEQRPGLLLLVLLLLSLSRRDSRWERTASPRSFLDQLISMLHHQVAVFTTGPQGFEGVLTAVNPEFITIYQKAIPPRAAFIPLTMITAITITNH